MGRPSVSDAGGWNPLALHKTGRKSTRCAMRIRKRLKRGASLWRSAFGVPPKARCFSML